MSHSKLCSWLSAIACLLGLPALVSSQIVISEVLFDPVGTNTARQMVEIRNLGEAPVDMQEAGYWLYFPPAQWRFPAGLVVAPGAVLTVHINRPGVSTASTFFTGIAGMRNLRGAGSQGDALGLFKSNLFGDPAELVDFVQWGAPGNGGEDIAVQAGKWPAGGFVSIVALREGSSIAYDGAGDAPSDWCIDGSPSLGLPNDECAPSFAQSSIVLNEVGYVRTGPSQYHPAVELKNVGTVREDLGGKHLVLGGGQHSYMFPTGSPDTLLDPGEMLVLHLGFAGTDGPAAFYSGVGTFRDLLPSDAVSFHAVQPFTDPTTIIDYVQWGTAPGTLEAAAVTAKAWVAGQLVDALDRRPRGSLAATGTAKDKTRWHVDNTGTIGKENDALPMVPVVINEVLVDPLGVNVQRGQVELRNLLAGEVFSLAGWKLCLESSTSPGTPRCYSFPPTASVPAGGFLVIHMNRTGLDSSTNVYTRELQDLNSSGGSLLLLAGNESAPQNLVDFLCWGPAPGFAEAMATAVGIWSAGASVDVSRVRDGSSIAYSGQGDHPESYRIDLDPTLGQDNSESGNDFNRRGDCDDSGSVDLSDAVFELLFLFAGAKLPLCANACDVNNDEQLDISDPVSILQYLFSGGAEPPAPGPDVCGADPDPQDSQHLDCGSYTSCR